MDTNGSTSKTPDEIIARETERLEKLVPGWLLRVGAQRVKLKADPKIHGAQINSLGELSIDPAWSATLDDQVLLALIAHEVHHYNLMREGKSSVHHLAPRWVRLCQIVLPTIAGFGIGRQVGWVDFEPLLLDFAAELAILCALLAIVMIPIMIAMGLLLHRWRKNPCHDEEFACDQAAAKVAGTGAVIAMLRLGEQIQRRGLRRASHWMDSHSHPSSRRRIARLKANPQPGIIDASEVFDWERAI